MMPTLDNDVLRSWPDLCRHPVLFVDVLRGHDVDAEVVARRLAVRPGRESNRIFAVRARGLVSEFQ